MFWFLLVYTIPILIIAAVVLQNAYEDEEDAPDDLF